MPYYAVIFTSKRFDENSKSYNSMSQKMLALAKTQKGFIDIESVRGAEGTGISVSYWQTLEDIRKWKENTDHLLAQARGRNEWYQSFKVKICKVEREYEFNSGPAL